MKKRSAAGYHGEVFPIKVEILPQGLTKVQPVEGYVVVGESETTGNDHRVRIQEGVEFYEKDGILYMKNIVPAEISCVVKERHDSHLLPPGYWEFKKQMEFDPVEEVLREAMD